MKSIHKLTLSLLIEKYSNESQLSNKVIELFEKLETFQVNIEDVLLAWELKEAPHVLELPEPKKEEQFNIARIDKPKQALEIEEVEPLSYSEKVAKLPCLRAITYNIPYNKLRIIKVIMEFGRSITIRLGLKEAKDLVDFLLADVTSFGVNGPDIMKHFKDILLTYKASDEEFVNLKHLIEENISQLIIDLNKAGLQTAIY